MQRANTICCFAMTLFVSLHFYADASQDGSQIIMLENKFGKPNLKKENWNKFYIAYIFQLQKKMSTFSNIWLNLTLLVYRVTRATGVVIICLSLNLNTFPEHSKIRIFSGIKFCDSMEHRIWLFWGMENLNCFLFAFSCINKKPYCCWYVCRVAIMVCLEIAQHNREVCTHQCSH